MRWYLIKTKPKNHFKAQENILKQGMEVFLPVTLQTHRAPGRFQNVCTPLFPGYLFAKFDYEHRARQVRYTVGVSYIVSFGTLPAWVPDEMVEGLRIWCTENHMPSQAGKLNKNDRVQIGAGPFTGAIAKILKVSPKERVVILLDFLGRSSHVSISSKQIRKIT